MLPVITHFKGDNVVTGTTYYSNQTSGVIIQGNAEAGTTITLFRNGSAIGTGLTDAMGVWSITFSSTEGNYFFTANASDGIFTSAMCPSIRIHFDSTSPYGNVCAGWSSSYSYFDSSDYSQDEYFHSVSEDGGTTGSGLDFDTASMTIIDVTDNQVISVNLTNNGFDKVNFSVIPSDAEIKEDGHEYNYIFEISDKAGNTWLASRTVFCDLTSAPVEILKIYDPLHSIITGTDEPATNTPDVNGYVDYYKYMTVSHQPTKIIARTPDPSEYHKGFEAYEVYTSFSPVYNYNSVSNSTIDPVTGSFTSNITARFYTSSKSGYLRSRDSAGNYYYKYFYLKFDNPCPEPELLKVYDPAHHEFVGVGETATNTPDANGYVNYFEDMHISTSPTKVIGQIDVSNMDRFSVYNTVLGTKSYTKGSGIDAVTGSFTVDLGLIYDGTHSIRFQIYDESGGYEYKYRYLTFIDGPPVPPGSIISLNYPAGGDYKITADVRVLPELSGMAAIHSHPQVIFVDSWYLTLNYAVGVLPAGETYPNVAGAYDFGDVWQDQNENAVWDVGEPFYDMPPRGVSDGQSFTIPNFLGIGPSSTSSWDNYYGFIIYPKSLDNFNKSTYYGRSWYTDWVNPHEILTKKLTPTHSSVYRTSAIKPTQLLVKCSKPSGEFEPEDIYGLIATASTITVLNAMDQEVLAPTSNWVPEGTLYDTRASTIDLSSLTFPEATYRVKIFLKNQMHLITEDESINFKIDDTAPLAQDFSPTEGSVSNSFTSFNAKVVDAFLSDNSEGSGLELDVSTPQIWPFRILTNQKNNPNSSNIDTLTFTIADGESFAKDHVGTDLPAGTILEAWEVDSGQYQDDVTPVQIIANSGNGQLTVKTTSGSNFAKNTDFVVLYPISCFTSNNGIDRVGAVPISPVTEDAQYVCKVLTLDKSGNKGVFYAPYSKLELAAGPITLTTDKTFLFTGLVPPDIATFTSSSIRTRKNNIIQDGQAVTVQRTPDNITEFTVPDANGLPGDGYQVYTGQNGAPTGNGQFAFGVGVNGNLTGVLNTICSIGLASGSSSPLNIVRIDPFSLSPDTTSPEITPANPLGQTYVSCTPIGYSGTNVPDNSLATWTISCNDYVLNNPTTSMWSMEGYRLSYWQPQYLSDGLTANYGQRCYGVSSSYPSAGANFTVDLGAGNEKAWTRLRGYTSILYRLYFDIQYSDDGTNWTTIKENYCFTSSGWREVSWPSVGAHRYWRLYQTNDPTGYCYYVYELSWYTCPCDPKIALDESPLPGHQTNVVSGITKAPITAVQKGTVNVEMEIGGRSATCVLNFLDRWPPDAPATMTVSPHYSHGNASINWTESIDHAGAGTRDYTVEQSINGASFTSVTTTTALNYDLAGLPDATYLFRVRATDNDGNIGTPTVASFCIVDNVVPPAIACSDIGIANSDPDEHYSWDPNVTFYFNPVDDRSGPKEVNVQLATAPDFSVLLQDIWTPNATEYEFTDLESGYDYYARVRIKDNCDNIGPFGTPSNGIRVHYTGLSNLPNAPTILTVASQTADPVMPIPLRITSGISVTGKAEASNLVMIYVDGIYKETMISNDLGSFSYLIDLPPGSHTIKVNSHNGFAQSPDSDEITVIIDTTAPTITRQIFDTEGDIRNERFLGTFRSSNPIGTIDFFPSDLGGAGYEITSLVATLTDIDDFGVAIVPVGTHSNPLVTSIAIISSERVRMVPSLAWQDLLQTGHRYRLEYEIKDKAGNQGSDSFDFVVDNLSAGESPLLPVTTPPNCNVKSLFVYDESAISWPNWPTAGDLVPLKWDAGDSAFMIDPAFNDPALVDTSATPAKLKFNTVAVYGQLNEADETQPAVAVGKDSLSRKVYVAGGYGSSVDSSVSAIGDANSFRFKFKTFTNGLHSHFLVDQDWAMCEDKFKVNLWVNAPLSAPEIPQAIEFSNASNPAIIYQYWPDSSLLFSNGGGVLAQREVIVTDNSSPLRVKVTVANEAFDQTVEIVQQGAGVIASTSVTAGNTEATLVIDIPESSGKLLFQVRTAANGFYSDNLPRGLAAWYFYWNKGDISSPETVEVYPVAQNYNLKTGADALPFPTVFSMKVKDTLDGAKLSFLEVDKSKSRLESHPNTTVAGTLIREYDTGNMTYDLKYQLSAAPTNEGTYYFRGYLEDAARPGANGTVTTYTYRIDITPPVVVNTIPANGTTVDALSSFKTEVSDPLLADGTPGSGPNMDPTLQQIFPYKLLGTGNAASINNISGTVAGLDTVATDHLDNDLPNGTEVVLVKISDSYNLYEDSPVGHITSNSGNVIEVTRNSGTDFEVGQNYAVLYKIHSFTSNDGINKIAAFPIQPALKGGGYFIYSKLVDNSLNMSSYYTSQFTYESAYGSFDLFNARASLYVGLFPPHSCSFNSSVIKTTQGNPLNPGTEVNAITNLGSFSPADANGIPGDGHQIACDATGKINFALEATGLDTGIANVKAVLGLASGTNSNVNFVQIPPFTISVPVATLTITSAIPNPSVTITTSEIGNAGDLIPDGTCLNLFADLGAFAPADAYASQTGHQVETTSGIGNFTFSSSEAGIASVSIEVGGRIINQIITFIDGYPPNAPGKPVSDNSLNNDGIFNLSWSSAADPGNSGIKEYEVQASVDGGAYTHIGSATVTAFSTSGLTHGEYQFRIRAVDNEGNVGAFSTASDKVYVDQIKPIGTILVNSGYSRTATTAVLLSLTASDTSGVTEMSFSNDGVSWQPWEPVSTSKNWTLSTLDGNKIVYVRYKDTPGNISVPLQDGIILDTTPPDGSFSIVEAPLTTTQNVNLTLSAVDGAGISSMYIQNQGEAAVTSLPYSTIATWTLISTQGTQTVLLSFVDGVGNRSASFSASIVLDNAAPSIPLVTDDGDYSPWNDKLHASWVATDTGTGIDFYKVSIGTSVGSDDIASSTNVGNVSEYTFSGLALDPSGATIYYFNVIAVDNLGHISGPGNSDGIKGSDPTPPNAVTITDDGGDYSGDATKLYAAWTAGSDPDSGIGKYEFSAGTSAGDTSIASWTDCGLNQTYTATGLALTHGEKYFINIRVVNKAGGAAVTSSDGITIDIVAPPSPTMSAIATYSSGTSLNVACNVVADALSGGTKYMFQRATDAGFTTGLVDSGWIVANSHTFTGLSDGVQYYYRVKSTDLVGNESAYSASVNSIQDSSVPAVTGYTDHVSANNDPSERWSRDFTVSFNADGLLDSGSGMKNVLVELSKTSDFAVVLSSQWLNNTSGSYTVDVSADLISGDWLYARAKFEDNVGNQTGWFITDGIQIDDIQPIAAPTTDNTTSNNSDKGYDFSSDSTIDFDFDFSDSISNVAKAWIQIASDNSFTNIVVNDSEISPLAKNFSYSTGADGITYYARIKVQDTAGNNSVAYGPESDGILVDLSAPSMTEVNDDGEYSPWIDKLHASWVAADSGSGIDFYKVSVGTSPGSDNIVAVTNVGNVTEHTFSSLTLDISGATLYYFNVIAVDKAGHESTVKSSDGIKGGDPTPPDPVVITYDGGEYSKDTTKLQATWNATTDPDSGLKNYEFSAGTAVGDTSVVSWTDCGLNLNYTATGLSLTHGQTYYINIRATNNGGTSSTKSSDGITIDTAAPGDPTMGAIDTYTGGNSISLSCSSVTDALSGGVKYMFQRATAADFSAGLADSGWITTNSHTFTSLSDGTHYYYRVKATDLVGNETAYSAAVDSIQDSAPPSVTEYTDHVSANNDSSERWSRDFIVSFTAIGFDDPGGSGKKNVLVELSKDNFSTTFSSEWLHNTTGDYTVDVSSNLIGGDWLYARAKFEDVAGNQTGWYQTDGIQIDNTLPVAGDTTDNTAANGGDKGYDYSSDGIVDFGFSFSDTISDVAKAWIQIASDENFTQIVVNDQELTAAELSNKRFTYTSGVDGVIYYARIKVQDHAGNDCTDYGGKSDGITVDLSAPSTPTDYFYINKKIGGFISEQTTATKTVYISFDLNDTSGIKKAEISSDGSNWGKVIDNPKNYGITSYTWELDTSTPGIKKIYIKFTDYVDHVITPPEKSIGYYPNSSIFIGTTGHDSYPVDTYDEYRGQNKYGSERSGPAAPVGGKSLKLEKNN